MQNGIMYSRILKPPERKSFFLFGPRGTGKTTWVKKAFPDALYLDLLEAELFNDSLDLGYKIYYWRTSNNMEVDFVLYGERGLFAFEVKRTVRVKDRMFSGLKSFLKEYPVARAFLVYGGNRRMRQGEIEVLPLEETLKTLPGILASFEIKNVFC